MQIGCKPGADNSSASGVPDALARSWAILPDHVKLAILALVEAYRHRATGAG